MAVQRLDTFLTESFIKKARDALDNLGFVSDEHDFAPYRETLSVYCSEIDEALHKDGWEGELVPGFLADHPQAGFAYFIYDARRFATSDLATEAVSRWLDMQYRDKSADE